MTWWWTQLKSLVRQECTSRDRTSLEAQQLMLCRFMWCRTGNQGSSLVSRAQTPAPQRHPSPGRHSPPTEKSHKLCLPFLSHCVHREQCYHSLGGNVSQAAASPPCLEVMTQAQTSLRIGFHGELHIFKASLACYPEQLVKEPAENVLTCENWANSLSASMGTWPNNSWQQSLENKWIFLFIKGFLSCPSWAPCEGL